MGRYQPLITTPSCQLVTHWIRAVLPHLSLPGDRVSTSVGMNTDHTQVSSKQYTRIY